MAGRGRPRKPKEQRTGYYFYTDEENAVIEYINTDSAKKKNELFESTLKPAFTRMFEIIIRRYFSSNIKPDEFTEAFNDTMSHVIEKMVGFKNKKGRAFSYLQTIAKNFLILRVREQRKDMIKNICYDDVSEETENDEMLSYNITDYHSSDITEIISETSRGIENYMVLKSHKLTNNEIKVGKALIQIMENWDDVFIDFGSNKFNKKSILMYITDLTFLPIKEVRKCMKKYKTIYCKTKNKVYQT
jgi:DNA-directed RNA polymerase specialized sigma24 family protein